MISLYLIGAAVFAIGLALCQWVVGDYDSWHPENVYLPITFGVLWPLFVVGLILLSISTIKGATTDE